VRAIWAAGRPVATQARLLVKSDIRHSFPVFYGCFSDAPTRLSRRFDAGGFRSRPLDADRERAERISDSAICRASAAAPAAAICIHSVGVPLSLRCISFDALNRGSIRSDKLTAAPVLGLRPGLASRTVIVKEPKPRSSTRSRRAKPETKQSKIALTIFRHHTCSSVQISERLGRPIAI